MGNGAAGRVVISDSLSMPIRCSLIIATLSAVNGSVDQLFQRINRIHGLEVPRAKCPASSAMPFFGFRLTDNCYSLRLLRAPSFHGRREPRLGHGGPAGLWRKRLVANRLTEAGYEFGAGRARSVKATGTRQRKSRQSTDAVRRTASVQYRLSRHSPSRLAAGLGYRYPKTLSFAQVPSRQWWEHSNSQSVLRASNHIDRPHLRRSGCAGFAILSYAGNRE